MTSGESEEAAVRRRQEAPEPKKIIAVIRSGRKEERFETWRYWEIVGELRWLGTDHVTAYDTAKWIQKAIPGQILEVQPGITIKITEKEINHADYQDQSEVLKGDRG